jgi:hypothetical protein
VPAVTRGLAAATSAAVTSRSPSGTPSTSSEADTLGRAGIRGSQVVVAAGNPGAGSAARTVMAAGRTSKVAGRVPAGSPSA